MVLLIVPIFAAGAIVLERRNGSAWVREAYHFEGVNYALNWGKWCVLAEENLDLRKKMLFQ